MRVLIALPVMLSLLCAGIAARVDAQIALPSVQLPRTLPSLPEIGAEPLIAVRETLAQVRLDRIATLLRDNRDRIEPDRNGQPAVRGVIIATGVDEAMIARAARDGFRLIDRDRIEGIDLDLVRFAVPEGHSLARAQKRLSKLLPDAEVDADHIYFASGPGGALPAATLAATASPGPARLGLIDGGVAAHPSVAGRVEQRGFAAGAPHASRHGTAVASLLIGSGAVRGSASGQRLLAADVYGSDPAGGNASAIARALGWLVQRGAAVTTISPSSDPITSC